MLETQLRPQVTDYGTLADLTADFDLDLAANLSRSVVMLAVSPPLNQGSGVLGGTESGGNTGPQGGPGGDVPDGGGTLGERESGGSGSRDGAATGGAGGGGAGGTGGTGGTGGGEAVGAGTGGKLPFSGLPLALVAGAGAVLSGAGLALRSALRRR